MDIIKCKNCNYYVYDRGACRHINGLCYPDPEDFCSHGEEKLPNLLPCPFCGSKYVRLDTPFGFFDKKAAIEAWNRRAEPETTKLDLGTDWHIQFVPNMDYETYLSESISGTSNERKIIKGYSYPVVMKFCNKKDYTVKYSMEFDRDDILNLINMLKDVVQKIDKGED